MCVCVCVCGRLLFRVVAALGVVCWCLLVFVGWMHVDLWWTAGVFCRASVCVCVECCVCLWFSFCERVCVF